MVKNYNWLQVITLTLTALLFIGSITWFYPSISTPVNQVVDTSTLATKADIDGLKGDISVIDADLNEDDVWEQAAIDLATLEWTENDYKAIFKVLKDIDDRDDISKVVIKDTDVTNLDVDDKDAFVVQELKIYYENDNGDNVKDYVIVETEILDNEIEDQNIYLK